MFPSSLTRNRWLWVAICVGSLWLLLSGMALAQAQQDENDGYWYTVQRGDSWSSIAVRTGVPVAVLQAANPGSIRAFRWLWAGERLWIPTGDRRVTGYWYTVQRGDSWSLLAQRLGIPMERLMAANPQAIRAQQWLLVNERIWIPGESDSSIQAAPGSALPVCPTSFARYPEAAILTLQRRDNNPEALQRWLQDCGALKPGEDSVVTVDLTGDGEDEVIVALVDPGSEAVIPQGELIVMRFDEDKGWEVIYRANAAGDVELLTVSDLNEDGKTNVVWSDTTCGAHTCFGTVFVLAWDGRALTDWTEGTIVMAYPDIRLEDVLPEGSGKEIVMHGGVIASVGAGPQRPWTEIWASVDGAPYQRVAVEYDASECLYHHLLDANRAFLAGQEHGFEDAIARYRRIIEDAGLQACWIRVDEEKELRNFAWFRLALAHAYTGDTTATADAVARAATALGDDLYGRVLQVWWTEYNASGDLEAACNEVTDFARQNPETWEFLKDWGYANPSFSPEEVCPILSP